MVANYQYLVTCMAFSMAEPFRKPIWSNYPFSICVVSLIIFNTLMVYLPASNPVASLFDLQPFTTTTTSYYSYKYWISAGIVINSVLTYGAEKLIINVLTRKSDRRLKL